MRRSLLTVLVACCITACGLSDDVPIEQADSAATVPSLAYPVTVSGVSSGGYMAVQVHVALADRVAGVGVVAGGPYHCAAGSVLNAVGRCMLGDDLEVASLVSFTREAAENSAIADTQNLQEARIWIFHGRKDSVVGRNVALALADYYREFVSADQISFVDNIDAAHGWPTLDVGGDCADLASDFINDCEFDAAGALLSHLYGDLGPRTIEIDSERLKPIDLSDYFESGSGVADTGYIFVPPACHQEETECRLHVSFHGCLQGAEFLDSRFAASAGLNEWADQNRIVVVYPQIESSLMNPKGCWDWWGYTGPQYDQKSGKQIAGVDAIITAFANQTLYK
ncbi:MAG: polyhydroxybutyrate depolymerase [Gammaproteobacteria bacterium]|nr:polyhydroxybutyrate depolymerase [Gammaproteobacteria bacterium]